MIFVAYWFHFAKKMNIVFSDLRFYLYIYGWEITKLFLRVDVKNKNGIRCDKSH